MQYPCFEERDRGIFIDQCQYMASFPYHLMIMKSFLAVNWQILAIHTTRFTVLRPCIDTSCLPDGSVFKS